MREAREEMMKKKYEGKRVEGIEGCEGLFVGGRLVAMNEVIVVGGVGCVCGAFSFFIVDSYFLALFYNFFFFFFFFFINFRNGSLKM